MSDKEPPDIDELIEEYRLSRLKIAELAEGSKARGKWEAVNHARTSLKSLPIKDGFRVWFPEDGQVESNSIRISAIAADQAAQIACQIRLDAMTDGLGANPQLCCKEGYMVMVRHPEGHVLQFSATDSLGIRTTMEELDS